MISHNKVHIYYASTFISNFCTLYGGPEVPEKLACLGIHYCVRRCSTVYLLKVKNVRLLRTVRVFICIWGPRIGRDNHDVSRTSVNMPAFLNYSSLNFALRCLTFWPFISMQVTIKQCYSFRDLRTKIGPLVPLHEVLSWGSSWTSPGSIPRTNLLFVPVAFHLTAVMLKESIWIKKRNKSYIFTYRGLHLQMQQFVGPFAKLREATFSFAVSVRPHGTTRLPLDWFSWNSITQYPPKICLRNCTFHYNLTKITGTSGICIYHISLNSSYNEKCLIKSRLKSGNACYHSVQNLLSSSLLSKNLNTKIYGTIILPVVLHGCETWSLTLR